MKVQTINPENGQIQMSSEDYTDLGKEIDEGEEVIKTLKLMSNFEDFPVDVSYPEVEGKEGEAFR